MVSHGRGDGERQLQELVDRLRSRLSLLEQVHGEYIAGYFRKRLAEETKRCQRYNHFCSVLVLGSRQTLPGQLYERIRPQLRATDIVAIVDLGDKAAQGDSEHVQRSRADEAPTVERVAAILPETGSTGSDVLLRRLQSTLLNMADVNFGIAVYPDDSTDPHELLRMATAAAA